LDEKSQPLPSRQVAPGAGDLWGFDAHRAEVGARQRAS
jgi:hypothetical protein